MKKELNHLDFLVEYFEEEEAFRCAYCGESFEKERIYPYEEKLYSGKGMLKKHLLTHNMVEEILKLPRSATGLTEVQATLIPMLHQGMKDQEIADALRISSSTVRNHRFRLREKEKQAKLFIKLMEHLEIRGEEHIAPHKGATMLDDRYQITKEEEDKVIKTYMTEEGALKSFPAREKKKIVVLRKIAQQFKEGRQYSEKEVNRVLLRIYEDHVLLRRYLIEYGFLDRTRDGAIYIRK
ncbi:DUF2087 domain-containing protein [Proteiniclasticum sp. SCR006]|uniref:DUF2087 domain-containing protein n=1 Tax=Proteiniclasticum aestuarii TaxID=2817862 RepID=A0A939H977_9CLOT|nr:DUF2087 domain-containing protein [Proteiniclasticum aestuarii]MBO1263707.1 DUF2087 domain-containing protein [Proteiniclasticum aestuarii]